MHEAGITDSSIVVALLILVAGIFSLELGISVAIFEVIAGIIARNWLHIGHQAWIDFHAHFGLLGLMFFAGFETDFPMLKANWRKSMKVGLTSFFLPATVMFLLTKYVFCFSEIASFLISIGLSTTSMALVYSVLKENHDIRTKAAQDLLSAAMIVDVISMISLMALFQGLSVTTFIVILMIPLTKVIVPKLGHWIFHRYHGNQIEFQIRFILLSLLSMVFVSETSSIHVAILAFMAGFFFSETLENHEIIEEKLKSIVFGLMAPVFFFKAGLSVDFSMISKKALGYLVVFVLVAFIFKFIGTYWGIRRDFKGAAARFSGLLFNFRLSFGIVVASFGLESKIIPPCIYFAMVSAIIIISFTASILLKAIPHEL